MKTLVRFSGLVPLLVGIMGIYWIFDTSLQIIFDKDSFYEPSVYIAILVLGLISTLLILLGHSMFRLKKQSLLFGKFLYSLCFAISLIYNTFAYLFSAAHVNGPLSLVRYLTGVLTPPLNRTTLAVILTPISFLFMIVLFGAKKKLPELFSASAKSK